MNPESKQYHWMRWILFWIFVVLFLVIVVCTVLAVFFGIGSPSEAEKSLLFKGFLGEIGAAVVALFYAIFGIRRGQSQSRRSLDRAEEISPARGPAAAEDAAVDLAHEQEAGKAEFAAVVAQVGSAASLGSCSPEIITSRLERHRPSTVT